MDLSRSHLDYSSSVGEKQLTELRTKAIFAQIVRPRGGDFALAMAEASPRLLEHAAAAAAVRAAFSSGGAFPQVAERARHAHGKAKRQQIFGMVFAWTAKASGLRLWRRQVFFGTPLWYGPQELMEIPRGNKRTRTEGKCGLLARSVIICPPVGKKPTRQANVLRIAKRA